MSTWDALDYTPGTLTLKAPNVTLDNFGLAYYITEEQGLADVVTDGEGVKTTKNSLIDITTNGNKVTLGTGTVFLGTPSTGPNPFEQGGTYLIMTSDNGFKDKNGNLITDANVNNWLTASIDGFALQPSNPTLRGGGNDTFKVDGTAILYEAGPKNSLAMNWQPQNGSNWVSGNHFLSRETEQDASGVTRENSFLTGDKVYISGSNSFTVNLPTPATGPGNVSKITVSGLVVGKQSMDDSNPDGVVTDGGSYTISGSGGITADDSKAFGKYVLNNTLGQTGMLQKYGNSTLTFTNTGGNYFKEGVELYGGTTQFTLANQLITQEYDKDGAVVDDAGIAFIGDSILGALNDVTLTNFIGIAPGVTGTFSAAGNSVFTYDGVLDGVLEGDNTTTFEKAGTGTVKFASNNDGYFTGQMKVSAGTMEVDGDYGGTTGVSVNAGTLSGIGTLGGNTTIAGGATLKPDGMRISFAKDPTSTAPTSLTIKGGLTFEAGSNFNVNIGLYGADKVVNPDHIDKVVVGGDTTISSDATLNVAIEYFHVNRSDFFTIIDASNGSVADPDAQFTLRPLGLPRGVTLLDGWDLDGGSAQYFQVEIGPYDASLGYGPSGRTHNETGIGSVVDWFVKNSDPNDPNDPLLKIQNVVTGLTNCGQNDLDCLNQLHGDLTANALYMAFKEPWRAPFNRLQLFSAPEAPPSASADAEGLPYPRVWAELVARYERVGSDGDGHGFTMRRTGGSLGVDRQISPDAVVGAAFRYTNPRLSQATGTATADDAEIGVYGLTRLPNGLDMKMYLGWSHQDYTFKRTVSLPGYSDLLRGSTGGEAVAASVEVIRPFEWRSDVRLFPLAALDYEKAWMDGYRESGGQAALAYDGFSMDRLTFRFGLDGDWQYDDQLALNFRVQDLVRITGPNHPSVDVRFAAAGPSAEIWGTQDGRNLINLGLGADWKIGGLDETRFYMNYDTKFNNRTTIHTGEAGLMITW
jgi:uncharacterized protein with beta-barrel porin domain